MFNFAVVGSLFFSHTLRLFFFFTTFRSISLDPLRLHSTASSIASLVTQFTKQSNRRVCKQANKWSSWRYIDSCDQRNRPIHAEVFVLRLPHGWVDILCNDMPCYRHTYVIVAVDFIVYLVCLLNSGHRYANMYCVRHNFTALIKWNYNSLFTSAPPQFT